MSRALAAAEPHKIRLGILVLALLLSLSLAGYLVRQRRAEPWDLTLPAHPSRIGRLDITRSRLLHWKMWSYPAAATVAEIEAFYDQALAPEGWTADGTESLGRAWVKSYRRQGWRLELRVVPAADGGQAVALLLSDLAESEDQRAR